MPPLPPTSPPLALRIRDLSKRYVLGEETVHALRNVSLDVPTGDYIAIMGSSGSGKSTLLNLLGCLDQPTSGNFYLGDRDVATIDDDQRAEVRATEIGFVFQSFYLLPALTVVENIEVPLLYSGRLNRETHERAISLASQVGLGDRLGHRPMQLSGGQQQRVAIARSLVNDPKFLLADEPTGNLDSATTSDILNLLDQLHADGRTLLLVTHEAEVASRTGRKIVLHDGEVQSDERRPPC